MHPSEGSEYSGVPDSSKRLRSGRGYGTLPSKDGTVNQGNTTLSDALRQQGQRVTRQRAAVYDALAASRSHPTAEEVFRSVREDVPGISLATVYNTLEVLVRCGLAARLSLSDGSARYDGQLHPHLHARCDDCGRVFDLDGSSEAEVLELIAPEDSHFSITGIRLELTGRCRDCDAA